MNNVGRLELWSLAKLENEHRCLWQTGPAIDTGNVAGFHGEVVEEGAAIIIAGIFVNTPDRP